MSCLFALAPKMSVLNETSFQFTKLYTFYIFYLQICTEIASAKSFYSCNIKLDVVYITLLVGRPEADTLQIFSKFTNTCL